MNREERLKMIYSEFDKCVQEFCSKTNGSYVNIFSEFKGAEKPVNLKYRFGQVYYNSFYIMFKYTAHATLNVSNSILEALIYLDKTEYAIPIPLPLFLDYCNITPTKPLVIPFISNKDAMQQAFESLGSILNSIIPQTVNICYNVNEKKRIIQLFADEMQYIFDVDCTVDTPPQIFEGFSDYFTIRFTVEAFANILKGNKEKAIKQLVKVKKLTGYEKRVLELLKSEKGIDLTNLSLIINNAKIGVNKTDFKELSAVFLPAFIMTIGLSIVYCAIYYILISIEGIDSVYLMGPIYGFPYCFLCAFITSIALSYFTRFKFYKLLFKKSYEQYCDIDYITNGGGSDKFMKGFLWIIIVLSLIFLLLVSKWNINFTHNSVIDNSKFFSVRGNAYSYSDIEKIYYKPNRINDFGEKLEFPSYVMVLNNGEEIDFYEFDEIDKYEDELLDFLQKKGIRIDR